MSNSEIVEVLNVKLKRQDPGLSWGFKVQGGKDFYSPLLVQKVNPDSLAQRCSMKEGDFILKIGYLSAENMTHNEARNAIISQGNDLELTLQRNGIPRRADYNANYEFPRHQLMTPENIETNNKLSPQIGVAVNKNEALLTQSYNSPLGLYSKENVANSLYTTMKNLKLDDKLESSQASAKDPIPPKNYPSYQFEKKIEPTINKNISKNFSPNISGHQPFDLVKATPLTPQRPQNNQNTNNAANKPANKPANNPPAGPRSFNRALKGSAVFKTGNLNEIPKCFACNQIIRGPFVSAVGKIWCPNHFVCSQPSCGVNLQDVGFIEENGKLYCEHDFEKYFAPRCAKCSNVIMGDCCYALEKAFHPECFKCTHCKKLIGNEGFHLEDGLPYCIQDFNKLFSTKCAGCEFPIEAGDKFVEALSQVFHVECFTCTTCHNQLEGIGFVAKGNKPYCKRHAY